VYVEGGGDRKYAREEVKRGFRGLLSELVSEARKRHIHWDVIACGGRERTFERFTADLGRYPDSLSVLLVDSEGPVQGAGSREHLRARDGWDLSEVTDEQVHLMVEAVEAWIVADAECLRAYYGQRFNAGALPSRDDLEMVSKAQLASALDRATRTTQKGEYHKIRHCPDLLEKMDAAKARDRCRYCRALFDALCDAIGAEHLK
jgi:hypothetical protein